MGLLFAILSLSIGIPFLLFFIFNEKRKRKDLHDQVASLREKLEDTGIALKSTRYDSRELALTLEAQKRAMNEGAIITITDLAGKAVEVNKAFCQLSGYSHDELIGTNLNLINSDRHPQEFWRELWREVKADRVWQGQIEGRNKNGEAYWLDTSVSPMYHPETGKLYRFFAVSFDISAEKKALKAAEETQKRLSLALESGLMGSWEYRPSKSQFHLDSVSRRLLGLAKSQNPNLEDLLSIISSEGQSKFRQALENNLIRGKRVNELIEVFPGTEQRRFLRIRGRAIEGEDSQDKKAYGIIYDVSREVLVEQNLQETMARAQEAAETKSNFLARMSHEIRTPLNAILGLTELSIQQEPKEKIRSYLEKVQGSGKNLLRIINDILDFSKIEAGKFELENIEFDLEKTFNQVSDLVMHRAHEKNLELVVGLPFELPKILIGDPLRINQILINLISNAIKFTDQGSIVVKVEVLARESHQIKLRFSVSDTGIGLSKEAQSRIFDSFSQADNSTSRRYGGTGLGLVISQNLVELMGGELRVESELGKGSTFFFDLELPVPEGGEIRDYQLASDLKGQKVMICDDNDDARIFLENALHGFGFTVRNTTQGQMCLDYFERYSIEDFSLIILDWKMPDLTGLEVASTLKAKYGKKCPPFLLVTAYNERDLIEAASEVGFSDTLMKPVSFSSLFNSIMVALHREDRIIKDQKDQQEWNLLRSKLRGMQVLLVEDNEINREVARDLLNGFGVACFECVNGQEAVSYLKNPEKRKNLSAVFMDLQMPVMDGYEATRQIRQFLTKSELPIIGLSADALKEVQEKALKVGMQAFVTKPIDSLRLGETLAEIGLPPNRKDRDKSGFKGPVILTEENPELVEQLKKLNPNLIDCSSAIKRLNGKASLWLKLLEKFEKQYLNFEEELNKWDIKTLSEDQLRRLHSLKGSAGNLGLKELFIHTKNLENLAKQELIDEHEWLQKKRRWQKVWREYLVEFNKIRQKPKVNLKGAQGDLASLASSLDELIKLVEDYSPKALNQMELLRLPQHLKSEYNQALEALRNFDFEEALPFLNKLKQNIKSGDS